MGPGASVLLKHPLTEVQLLELEQWIHSIISNDLQKSSHGDWWPLWIKDGQGINLTLAEAYVPCAFGIAIENKRTEQDYTNEDGSIDGNIAAELQEEREYYLDYPGYVPKQCINIFAGCKDLNDHRILGQLIFILAERYNGIIDFGGAISPPLKPGEHWDKRTLEEIYEYVHTFPGKIFEMYYTISSGKRWVHHIADTDFMSAWLKHPHFYMIK